MNFCRFLMIFLCLFFVSNIKAQTEPDLPQSSKKIKIVSHIVFDIKKAMASELKKGRDADKKLSEIVRENPELFTDENILALLDGIEDIMKVPSRAEEKVIMGQVDGLILARMENKTPVGGAFNDRYQKIKEYLESGAKDQKLFNDRMDRNFREQN